MAETLQRTKEELLLALTEENEKLKDVFEKKAEGRGKLTRNEVIEIQTALSELLGTDLALFVVGLAQMPEQADEFTLIALIESLRQWVETKTNENLKEAEPQEPVEKAVEEGGEKPVEIETNEKPLEAEGIEKDQESNKGVEQAKELDEEKGLQQQKKKEEEEPQKEKEEEEVLERKELNLSAKPKENELKQEIEEPKEEENELKAAVTPDKEVIAAVEVNEEKETKQAEIDEEKEEKVEIVEKVEDDRKETVVEKVEEEQQEKRESNLQEELQAVEDVEVKEPERREVTPQNEKEDSDPLPTSSYISEAKVLEVLFSGFCAERKLSAEEISIDLWADFITALRNTEDVLKRQMIIDCIQSILDNSYTRNPWPSVVEILGKIAANNILNVVLCYELYSLLPATTEEFDHMQSVSTLHKIFAVAGNNSIAEVIFVGCSISSEIGIEEFDSFLNQLVKIFRRNTANQLEESNSVLQELVAWRIEDGRENEKESPLKFSELEPFLQYLVSRSIVLCQKDYQESIPQEQEKEKEEEDEVGKIQRDLEETLRGYEERLQNARTEYEQRIYSRMVSMLRQQITEAIETPPAPAQISPNESPNNKQLSPIVTPKTSVAPLTREQRRERMLSELFAFFARQQIFTGKHSTFAYLKVATELWTLENLFIFVKVFNLLNDLLNRAKALELFKKASSNSREITFSEFKSLLDRFAQIYYSKSLVEEEGDEDEESREKRPLTEEERRERFYERLYLDDPAECRRHMAHYGNAFWSRDKDGFRGPIEGSLKPKLKLTMQAGKTPEETKEEVRRRIEQRNREKEERDTKAKAKLRVTNDKSPGIPNALPSAKGNAKAKDDPSNKVTWEQLEQLSLAELKGTNEFKPGDLIDENEDDEDRLIMKTLAVRSTKNGPGRPLQSKTLSPKNLQEGQQGLQMGAPLVDSPPKRVKVEKGAGGNPRSVGQSLEADKVKDITGQYKQRANEVEAQTKLRESQLLKNVIERTDNKVKQGMQAVSRVKPKN